MRDMRLMMISGHAAMLALSATMTSTFANASTGLDGLPDVNDLGGGGMTKHNHGADQATTMVSDGNNATGGGSGDYAKVMIDDDLGGGADSGATDDGHRGRQF